MAPNIRGLQLIPFRKKTSISAGDEDLEDLEDVRLLDSYREEEEKRMSEVQGDVRKIQVKITGMTCSACSSSIESALQEVNGVIRASVALLQNKADVVFDPKLVKEGDIKAAIEDAGFDAEILAETKLTPLKSQKTLSGQFRIGGMTCAACVNSVEGVLKNLPGVKRAVVALATSMGEVEYDPLLINKEEIVGAIEDAGFDSSFVKSDEQDKVLLSVHGIMGENDFHLIKEILGNLEGVRQFDINKAPAELEVVFDPEIIGLRSIVDSIVKGSNGKLNVDVRNPFAVVASSNIEESSTMFRLFTSSLVLSVPILFMWVCHRSFIISPLLMWRCGPFLTSDLLKWILSTIIQFIVGKRFYVGAYRALRNGSANMDVLVALGTSASYFYSVGALLYGAFTEFWPPTYFETSAMLITSVLFGKYLEVVAKGRTSDAIKKLIELTPATALLLVKDSGGKLSKEREIDAFLIQPGDILKVLPGSKIPSDGVVVWGSSYVNESMVTGESVLILKEVDEPVIGGTINSQGVLHIRATKVGSNTVLSQIISLVESAQMCKAPIQKFADFVASIFVPTVVGIALLTFSGWYVSGSLGLYPSTWLPRDSDLFVFSLMFAISVVVIACPCALGLATPTAVMVATGVGANHGVLIKGGDALERAQNVKHMIFDKTGTLTQGKAAVTTVKVFTEMELGHFLTLVASAEFSSEHPLARAIVDFAYHFHNFGECPSPKAAPNQNRNNVSDWLFRSSDFTAIPGKGVQCMIQGKRILVGNRKLLIENEIVIPALAESFLVALEEAAKTGVLVAVDDVFTGVLGITDPLKREAAVVIEGLRKMGIRPVMVTGDNWRTSKAVAKEIGIEDVRAEVMPSEKADVIRALQRDGSVVAMVGDGINDSPALAAADVGMAIGAGTDIAIEAADYVLMKSNLEDVITAIDLSRKTFTRIRLNYIFAMAYNIIAVPVAAGILFPFLRLRLPPWVAGACMAFSSVSVVCSSLSLKRYKKPRLTTILEITVE